MGQKRRDEVITDEDSPEMTAADFKRARLMRDVMPEVVEAFKRARGRPRSSAPKERVSLRLDPKILAAYKATGPGWQRRIAETLARAAPRLRSKRRSSKAAA
jgi:uncharacterized protein (DUF4415 family)